MCYVSGIMMAGREGTSMQDMQTLVKLGWHLIAGISGITKTQEIQERGTPSWENEVEGDRDDREL